MVKILAACGNDCSACPRHLPKTEEELKRTAELWEKAFENLKLTGEWAEDVIAVAETQFGYAESELNFDAVLNKEEMLENMNRFASAVRASLDLEPALMQQNILRLYDGDDRVTRFNRDNIRLI